MTGLALPKLPPRILVIEEDDRIRGRMVQALRGGEREVEVLEATDGPAGLRSLLTEPVDLVVCGVGMVAPEGHAFLQAARGRWDTRSLPVMLLIEDGSPEARLEGLEAGANDVLIKPFHDRELMTRVETLLQVQVLQDELQRSTRALEDLVRRDELTGLYHRRFLGFLLHREFARAVRNPDYGLGILMIEVDQFREVSREHGPLVGDLALRHVARHLRDSVRREEIVARFGEAAFAIVLAGVTRDTALHVAERIRATAETANFGMDDHPLPITLSVGVALFDPTMRSPEELLTAGEEALRAAGEHGLNRVGLAPAPV
jgi:diguanylate cyclase (GGDEF)-like protein